MFRTTLSVCALFASLLLVSKWLHESSSTSPARPAAPESAEPPRAAQAPAAESGDGEAGDLPSSDTRQAAALDRETAYIHDPAVTLVKFDKSRYDAFQADREAQEAEQGRADADALASDAPESTESDAPTDADSEKAKTKDAAATESATSPAKPQDKPIELTPELIELRGKIRQCLAHYYFHPENVATRSPWGAMHAMIAYGVDTELIANDKRVNAIGYLCFNGTCNGQQLFHTSSGRIQASVGPGVQGHPAQFLAMLAQSRVKTDYPMHVSGQSFTVADLIQHEKDTCRPASELTFKLIAFSHYLKSDEMWRSNDGQDWDIPRLIKEELKQTIHGAACGGTHRMTGFSYAVRKREQRNEPFEGQWLRAKKFVEDYHEYTFKLQNPDGSFSTEWFVRRADYGDSGRRLQTTGHIAEWLAFSLKKEQLVEPRMVKSIDYLTTLLLENPNERWSIGPLGHGVHALAIYDERVFGGTPGKRAEQLASAKEEKARAAKAGDAKPREDKSAKAKTGPVDR